MRRLVVAVGVAGFCLIGAGSAWATFPGTNGRISYVASNGSIHTILPSGDGDRQLTPAHFGSTPSWSPSGRRIAFTGAGGITSEPEIFSMTADGRDVHRLTNSPRDESNPAYSPSGHRIVFGRDAPVGPVVMTMRANGSDVRRLGQGVAYQWSLDGRWITYVIGRTAKHRPSIWAMHPNGTDKHRLVFLGANGGGFDDFSPDGKHFVFTRCGYSECHWLVARADGSHVHPAPCDHVSGYSPDGRSFLGEDENAAGNFDLVRVSVASCSESLVVRNVPSTGTWQPVPAP